MTFGSVIEFGQQLAPAFVTTLWLSGVSLLICTGASLLIAVGLLARVRAMIWLVDVLINVPLVIKLFVCFYLLRMEPQWCAIIGLVLHQSAFAASILYGGLKEVPPELEEAALIGGLSPLHTFVLISLPAALRMVAPALVLQAAEIVKNSSVASLIGIVDLTASVEAYQNRTFAYTQGFLGAAIGYAILTLPLMGLGAFWERRLTKGSSA